MGRRIKLTAEEKKVLILECLAGRLRMREAAREARLGHSTMENWISRYRSEGASGLRENGNQAKCQYSWGVKRRVVGEYLSGQGSSMVITEKYKPRSGTLCWNGQRSISVIEKEQERRLENLWREVSTRWRNGSRRFRHICRRERAFQNFPNNMGSSPR